MDNRLLINTILVVGFCMGTIGAAGMASPPEGLAWPLFIGGLVIMIVGGVLHRKATRGVTGDSEAASAATGEFQAQLKSLVSHVVELDDSKDQLGPDAVRDRIDALLRDEYFDFTSRHEEWIALLGFNRYASIWDGIAVAERLLSRAWSMTTDGHVEEGMQEIPLARQRLEQALAASANL